MIINEALNLPKRLYSLLSGNIKHKIKFFCENNNLAMDSCKAVESDEARVLLNALKNNPNNTLILVIYSLTTGTNPCLYSATEDSLEQFRTDIRDGEIIDGFILSFSDMGTKTQDRAEAQKGSIDRKLNVDDFDLRKGFDKSGYILNPRKYIEELNNIRRVSDWFEKRLMNELEELSKLYKFTVDQQFSEILGKMSWSENDSVLLSSYKSILDDINRDLMTIKRTYKDYVLIKSNPERAKDLNISLKKKEQEIESLLADLQNLKIKYRKELQKISLRTDDDIYESKKSTFSRIFEAVKIPKLIKETEHFKVYTKPFSKASLCVLLKTAYYNLPRGFNNYDAVITCKQSPNNFIFVSNNDSDYSISYDSDFYKYSSELINLILELYSDRDDKLYVLQCILGYRFKNDIPDDMKIQFLFRDSGYIEYSDIPENLKEKVKEIVLDKINSNEVDGKICNHIIPNLIHDKKLSKEEISQIFEKLPSTKIRLIVYGHQWFDDKKQQQLVNLIPSSKVEKDLISDIESALRLSLPKECLINNIRAFPKEAMNYAEDIVGNHLDIDTYPKDIVNLLVQHISKTSKLEKGLVKTKNIEDLYAHIIQKPRYIATILDKNIKIPESIQKPLYKLLKSMVKKYDKDDDNYKFFKGIIQKWKKVGYPTF